MESSVGLVIRALVMLACLAVVPLVAMYGKYVPDFAQAVMEAYKARTQAKGAADPRAAGSDAPPFAPSATQTAGGLSTSAGSQSSLGAPAPWPDLGQVARPITDSRQSGAYDPAGSNAGLERASFNAPVGGQSPGSDNPSRSATAQGSTVPSRFPPRTDASGAAAAGDSASGQSSAASADNCTAQFRHMEQRLRDLGASYYLLETWGSSGDRYRFLCNMAIAGNAHNNRVFQATAADPLQAMQDVLDQVEQSRGERQP